MDSSRASINDLAKFCAHSADATEWEEFMRRCAHLVSLVAWRVCRLWTNGASTAMVDDIVQEVFLKLCEQERRILREFEPRGEDSFLGLLRIISASVANDYFRRLHSAKRGGKVVTMQFGEEDAIGQGASVDSTTHGAGQLHQSVLLTQLDRMLRSDPKIVAERDRAFFWLYYLQGFTAEEIAGLTGEGLTAKGVESALRRTTIWLRGEVAQAKPGTLI